MNKIVLLSKSAHTSIIITGFLMLREQGIVDFEFVEDYKTLFYDLPTYHIIEAFINGKVVAFDLDDDVVNIYSNAFAKYIKRVDLYFKRSYPIEFQEGYMYRDKIFPLGLFYRVTHPKCPLNKFYSKVSLKSKILGYKDKDYYTTKVFEPSMFERNYPKAMFFTRLWGDENNIDYARERDINKNRIAIIRLLKKELKEYFLGGVSNSLLAQQICPDLILPEKYTRRDRYISFMKTVPISISSKGLHGSINGKIAEAVAAGRAIVCEELEYKLPDYSFIGGSFVSGENYYSYKSPQECYKKVNMLIHNPDIIREMQKNNRLYYSLCSRPDRLLYCALKENGII